LRDVVLIIILLPNSVFTRNIKAAKSFQSIVANPSLTKNGATSVLRVIRPQPLLPVADRPNFYAHWQ